MSGGDAAARLDQAQANLKSAEDKVTNLQEQLDPVLANLTAAQDQNMKDRSALKLQQQQIVRLQADAHTAWVVAYAGLALGVVAAIVIAGVLVLAWRWRKQQEVSSVDPARYAWSGDRPQRRRAERY